MAAARQQHRNRSQAAWPGFVALATLAAWLGGWGFVPGRFASDPAALRSPTPPVLEIVTGASGIRGQRVCEVMLNAAKASGGAAISDGDTIYIKTHTGRYIGELDGTSRKEWVKARGTKKDADHALTIEKPGGGEIESGDTIKIVMPLSVTNGTKIHMDIVGSAVRARHYDPRGEWQKMTIVKQEGGPIRDGDTIFIRSVFKNGRDYMDANPLEKAADGEVKCRWPDEGQWQVMTIEK